jgi:hypothetical protein
MDEYTTFFSITVLLVAVSIGFGVHAYKKSQDTFHPLLYLSLAIIAFYVYIPLQVITNDPQGVFSYLSKEQLEFVQTLNLLSAIALYLGVLKGGGKVNRLRYLNQQQAWLLSPVIRKRVEQGAIFFGLLGLVAFLYTTFNVGGFVDAYSRSYGGGSAASGYIREAEFWTIPALLFIMVGHIHRPLSKLDWMWVILFSSPHLIQGFLGARRGPTAFILGGLIVGWYLIRYKRPTLIQILIGSFALGTLMLFLVANRGEIYIGSDFEFRSSVLEYQGIEQAHSGNEFIYGSGSIIDAKIRDKYFWGGRYATVVFIRPIPRQIWPTKYEDASRFFGIPNLDENMGTGGASMASTLGWQGAVGAAPGLIADMWIEFWWFSIVAMYAIGWTYGMAWQKMIIQGGLWIPLYTMMTALSAYLIFQTLEAMLFRFLFTAGASILIWKYATRGQSLKSQQYSQSLNHEI